MTSKILPIIAYIAIPLFHNAQVKLFKISNSNALQITQINASSRIATAKPENETFQRKCATPVLNTEYETWLQQAIQKQEQFANAKVASIIYTIPVVFHIIHNGQAVGTTRNISQAQVNSQITALNNDYRKTNTDFSTWVTQSSFVSAAADCEINFCLAKVSPTGAVLAEPGIDRVNTTTKGWTAPPYSGINSQYIEQTIKPGSSWDPNKYLNIWVLEFSENGLLGYAQLPTVPSGINPIQDIAGSGGDADTDGVVLGYKYVGTVGSATSPNNKGRTASHEIGHWLGLRHIWGDDGGSCSGSGDYVLDTPNQGSEVYGCPTTSGVVKTDACSPITPGINYQNYMDYGDDACLVMFTTGQKARMQACMANCPLRMSLTTATVCALPISLEEATANAEISIYPNPSNGELNVSIEVVNPQDYNISIINTLGQTIKEIKQSQSNGGILKFDLSNSPAGVYFITYKSKSYSKTKRVVLQ